MDLKQTHEPITCSVGRRQFRSQRTETNDANDNKGRASMALFLLDKVDFRTETIMRN